MVIRPGQRAPLLLIGFVALALGVGAGLGLMGWTLLLPPPNLLLQHGALMICGFFGTLISLERAVALGRPWVYAGPALAAAATLGLIFKLPLQLSILLYLLASLLLSLASWQVYRQHAALFTATLALAVSCWAAGNALWLMGAEAVQIRLWWLMFLILTIAGERLELSRFLSPPPKVQQQFGLLLVLLLASLLLCEYDLILGTQTLGGLLLLLSLWLARNDIAKRTVRIAGLTRFIALCLLSAYFWLAVAGGLMLVSGLQPGTPHYDAALHAVTLGFVIAMVFGHAPIILPSVLKINLAYSPMFYLHLALLQLSLVMRMSGDLGGNFDLRSWGGLLNAAAILLFLLNTLLAALRRRQSRSSFRAS